ncbi:MAG: TonB-dependent receptor plug domain-containing protein, partial [Nitrospirae bacterium]|nr:TonB-dependent receptor plug domain-containing protein [Nitrospirota bacterium]
MFRSRSQNSAVTFLFLSLSLVIILSSSPAFAMSEEERKWLLLYFNVEVVTKEDIELTNAHTLADVLNTVNGVQVMSNGVNNEAYVLLQASDSRHVAIFMDGIPLNNLSNFLTEVGSIPVEHIEKIETIKGPASSSWGSSLGGVINIITKSPAEDEKIDGKLSVSYGEEDTGDFRAGISNKKGKFGYYLTAGRQQTDGFRPVSDVGNNNLFTKFTYDISDKTDILFTMLYGKTSRGRYELIDYDESGWQRFERLHSGIFLNTRPDSR